MTIAFDSSAGTSMFGTVTPITWQHSPIATPRGAAIGITQEPSVADTISSITYGGVALTRVVRATDVASETGSADWWFKGSGLPAGPQNVVVTLTAADPNQRIHLTSVVMTAAGDIEVIDFDSINSDATNPSVTLQYAGRTCLALAAQYGGASDPSAFTPNANCTSVSVFDFFAQYSAIIRQTIPGSTDFAIGGTASLEDCAFAAIALSEVTSLNTGTAQNPVHTYAAAGTYAVTLIVTDNDGDVSTPTTKNVVVT